MARTDRQQRRQRRAEKDGTPPLRPAPRPQPVEEKPAVVAAAPSAERSTEGRRGFPGVRFVRESIAELKKVEWPTQQKVVSGTAVVIVACVLVGAFLYVNDRVWSYLVQHILLR